MKRFTLLLTAFLTFGSGLALADVKGTVVSGENDEPVIGASIVVKGTTNGTITDMDGVFELPVSAGDVLVVSYIGMKTQEVPAKNGMTIHLEEDAQMIDEVISVAYGTSTKKAFTGAAQSKRGEELAKMQVSDVSKSLDGAMSGVQVVSSSGQPGESASIRIRGVGSMSASQAPLIVVDGIPYEGSLNSIPTQDIASLTVLKDAAANSMYGARGSNGVILITTKRGETGKINVNLEARVGGNMRGVPAYDIITDPGEYYEMAWEAIRNNYLSRGSSYLAAGIAASNDLIAQNLRYNIYQGISDSEVINPFTGRINPNASTLKWKDNWLSEPFQTGLRQEYNLNVSGGTDKTNYYISAGFLDDNGYIANSGFQRFNVRAKVEQEVAKWLKVGINTSYAHTKQDSPTADGNGHSNLFMFSQMIAPIYPVYSYNAAGVPQYGSDGKRAYDFGDGELSRPYASGSNPLATNVANIYNSVWDVLNLRGFLDFTLYKGLKLTVNASYDVYNINTTSFMTPIGGDAKKVNGRGSRATQRYEALNTNQLLTYENTFGEHGLNLLVGHEFKMDNSKVLSGSKLQFYDSTNPELINGGVIDGLTSYTSGYRVQGFMARAEYNYAERYYVSASYRCDGSSYFAPESRWGHFWSVGASWRMKEENWLRDVEAIHDLKLKASYGTQGNDAIGIGSSPYLDLYGYQSMGDGQPSVYLAQRGNRDLTWEKSNNLNIGLEMGLFDRLDIEADFFIKETKDMIYAKPLPPSVGAPSYIYTNEMDMRNIGVEVTLGATLLKTRDVKWTVDLNLTHYKNALTRLPADKKALIAADGGYALGHFWRSEGGSIYDFYDYHYLGVDASNGLPMYEVTDKDYEEAKQLAADNGVAFDETKYGQLANGTRYAYETSNASQKVLGKTAIPDLYGGLSTTLEFYGFDLSVQTAFQIGGYVYDSFYQSLMGGGTDGTNWHKDIFKRWTPSNTNTDVPRVEMNKQSLGLSGDAVLTSASYFSLRNITLGYTFPKKWMDKAKIKSLRLYVVADNVALASARKGLDPRQSFSGDTDYNYSAMATVSGGITIGF